MKAKVLFLAASQIPRISAQGAAYHWFFQGSDSHGPDGFGLLYGSVCFAGGHWEEHGERKTAFFRDSFRQYHQYRKHLSGIECSDNLGWDAHKWLMQTYGCRVVLVSHMMEHGWAMAELAQKMIAAHPEREIVSPAQMGL